MISPTRIPVNTQVVNRGNEGWRMSGGRRKEAIAFLFGPKEPLFLSLLREMCFTGFSQQHSQATPFDMITAKKLIMLFLVLPDQGLLFIPLSVANHLSTLLVEILDG